MVADKEGVDPRGEITPDFERGVCYLYRVAFGQGYVTIDGKRVALVCAVITIGSLLLAWLVFSVFVASLPPQTLDQLRSLNPDSLNDLKDLMR